MKRLVAIGLVMTLGSASAALAAEPLSVAAARAARENAAASAKADNPALRVVSFAVAAGVRDAALAQGPGQGGTISSSGMSKRTKAMIYLGAAVAFVGVAYGIDHHVRDVTPSTLGTRQD